MVEKTQTSFARRAKLMAMRFWKNFSYSAIASSYPTLREQAFVVNIYSIVGFLAVFVFGTLHITVEHNPLLGYLELASGIVMLINILGLRLTHNVLLARSNLLLTILALLLVMLSTGGTQGTGIFWFFVFPASAFFLTNKTAGLWWMAVMAGSVLGMTLLAEISFITLAYSLTTIRQMLATLLVVAVGIYIYQQSREQLFAQTQVSKQRLQAEKIKAETVLKNIDEGVIATDNQGRIAMMNPAAEAMLGWNFSEVDGKSFTDIVPSLGRQNRTVHNKSQPIRKILTRAVRTNMTMNYRRKDGSTFPVAVSGRSIALGGRVLGAIGTFRDITQERAIDRAKSEFITLASHQLRTPISAISWLTEMMLAGDAGTFTPEQQEYVEQLQLTNQRSAAIVEAMLTISSLELGSLTIKPISVNLPLLIHSTLQAQIKLLGKHKQLHVSQHCDETLATTDLDPFVIKVILQNLISNAIKYTPRGGKLSIKAIRSQKTLADNNDTLLIEVSDTGYGIPKTEQAKVFTKLFRADNIKNKDTDGTGLGLYIVKALVEYVGGRLWFESAQDKGSTFSVLLPSHAMKRQVMAENAQGETNV